MNLNRRAAQLNARSVGRQRTSSMPYEFEVVRIFVSDFDRSLRFYSEVLGFALASRLDGWAQFQLGAAAIAIEHLPATDPEARSLVGRYSGVSLRVPDIEVAHRELTAKGVEFLGPPEKQPWGGTLAHLRDPDGNVLTLVA